MKGWFFDIGAHVKQGQLLAEIESPEVDQQLQQARADLETAQANLAAGPDHRGPLAGAYCRATRSPSRRRTRR